MPLGGIGENCIYCITIMIKASATSFTVSKVLQHESKINPLPKDGVPVMSYANPLISKIEMLLGVRLLLDL